MRCILCMYVLKMSPAATSSLLSLDCISITLGGPIVGMISWVAYSTNLRNTPAIPRNVCLVRSLLLSRAQQYAYPFTTLYSHLVPHVSGISYASPEPGTWNTRLLDRILLRGDLVLIATTNGDVVRRCKLPTPRWILTHTPCLQPTPHQGLRGRDRIRDRTNTI